MATIDDGGPAFSHSYANGQYVTDGGMSLRDYFAGLALQAQVSCFYFDENGREKVEPHENAHNFRPNFSILEHRASPADLARFAYRYADAMLAARQVVPS